MSNAKFTPGPWGISNRTTIYGKVNSNRFETLATVATLPCIGGNDELACERAGIQEEANALLIASAPALLAALEELLRVDDEHGGAINSEMSTARYNARKAIAAAKGEQ